MIRTSNFRKTAWLMSVCFISFILVSAVVVDNASAERVFIRFGGSNPGGSWYTIAGGITSLFNKEIKDMNASSVATGGSVDCNRQARKHNLDTWLSHSLHAYDNWNGVGIFKDEGKFQDFRMLAGVYESWHHFVALEKSGIKTMSDLAGKKIAVGSAGSGAASNSENILKALGLFDKVEPLYLTFDASGRAMTDGQADAIGMSSAPMPVIVTVEALHKIHLIALTDQELDTAIKKYPAYKKSVMPAGTYKSWQKDYPCIGFQVYWMAHKELDPQVAYDMLKVAFDPKNKDFLAKVHRQLKTLSPVFDGMQNMGIPLHPGAVKYYKEKGMSVPAELIKD
ncbi:MAG: TAXI family TRAP transporter solute-binding subunit [Proteobacteria bacterium]|nr:TAXI family TRAP transporter solute-binding subunit [Pseudomonadota bacterium]